MKIRKSLRALIDFILLKKSSNESYMYLVVFFFIIGVVAPLVSYFSKQGRNLGEYYCYQINNGKLEDGVAVKNKAKIDRFMTYFNSDSNFKIPDNDSFIMDTILIKKCSKVEVLAFLRDSTLAHVKLKNRWYDPTTRMDNEFRYGYLPVYLLHSREDFRCLD